MSCAGALCAAAAVHAADAGKQTTYEELKGMNLDELLEVQVSSVTGFVEKLQDAPSAIQVISGDDISRSSALTLAESLRLANNLDIAQKNPHDWAVSARGFNANVGNKLLVLIDGRSVYTPLFAGVYWNAQDYVLEDIDQIEVISGPGGTLWGANAVNGVINVHTKSAADTQGGLAQLGVGVETQDFDVLRYGGKLAPNVYYRVYGKFMANDAAVTAAGAKANDGWSQKQAGFRIDALPSASETLTFQGDVYSGDLDIPSGDAARLAGANLIGRWTKKSGDDAETRVQAYFDRTHIADPFPATAFAGAGYLKDDTDTYDLEIQHTQRVGDRQRITAGAGYRMTFDRVRQQAPNVAFLPADLDQSLPSFFVQDELHLRPTLAFTFGSKFEHNDYSGFEWEPSLRLQWKPQASETWWTAVSRAVRMPSRFDRDLYEPAPPNSLLAGASHFISETLIAYEAGWRSAWNSRASTSVAVFYNDYDRLRSWGITPVTLIPITFQNGLDAKSYGVEFNADFQLTPWWRLNAGYNFLQTDIRVKPGQFDLQNALDETEDPKHQVALHSYMDVANRVQLDLAWRWIGELQNNNSGVPGTVPAYAELDAHVSWRLNDSVDLALVGRNLLHAQHPEYGPPGPAREQLQRSVLARVDWRF